MIILQTGEKNPYAKNPHFTKKGPATQVTRKGILYKKIDYLSPFSLFHRLIKLLYAIALTVFTAFLALAFETPKRLYREAFEGHETLSVLKPLPSKEPMLPTLMLSLPIPLNKEENPAPWHEDPYLKFLAASPEDLKKEAEKYTTQNPTKQDVPALLRLSYILRVQASHKKTDKTQYENFVNQSNDCLKIALKLCHKVVFDFLSDLQTKKQLFIDESVKMMTAESFNEFQQLNMRINDFATKLGELKSVCSLLSRKN